MPVHSANLQTVRRLDPAVVEVLATNPAGCLYTANEETGKYIKDEMEGPLFLYSRTAKDGRSPYAFLILNRFGVDNFVCDIWSEKDWWMHGNFCLWQPRDGQYPRVLSVSPTMDGAKWFKMITDLGKKARLKLEAERVAEPAPVPAQSTTASTNGQSISIDALFGALSTSTAAVKKEEPPAKSAPLSSDLLDQLFGPLPPSAAPAPFPTVDNKPSVNLLEQLFAAADAGPSIPQLPAQPSANVDVNALLQSLATAPSVPLPQTSRQEYTIDALRTLLGVPAAPAPVASQKAVAASQPFDFHAFVANALPAAAPHHPLPTQQARQPSLAQQPRQQPATNGHHAHAPPPAWQASNQAPRQQQQPSQSLPKTNPVRANNALVPAKVGLGRGPPPPVKESARPRGDGPPSLASSSSGPSSPRSNGAGTALTAASLVDDIMSMTTRREAGLPAGLSRNDFARSLISLLNTDAGFVDALYAAYRLRS